MTGSAPLTPTRDRTALRALLATASRQSHQVLAGQLRREHVAVLDLTESNESLRSVDLSDPVSFGAYVKRTVESCCAAIGVGRYAEDRVIYRHSALFAGEQEPRTIHLGIDLFVPAGTPVFAPLAATVHSVANNAASGDYGPTILLRHDLEGIAFHTLMGHLHPSALDHARPGQRVEAGALIATVGAHDHNGGWPPHLHFQIIDDVGTNEGDYPGVAAKSDAARWLDNCPDPNLLLRIPGVADEDARL